MAEHDDNDRLTPAPQRRQRGDITVDDRLDGIEVILKEIQRDMNKGATSFATQELRIASLERIVYGLCAVVGVTLAGSVLALVLRTDTGKSPAEPRQVIYMQPNNSQQPSGVGQ